MIYYLTLFINNNLYLFFNSFTDYAVAGQYGFNYPASPAARGIIDLHNHIMFFLIYIIVFTFIMIFFTIKAFTIDSRDCKEVFNKSKKYYNVKITHNTILEIIWIIIPSIILVLIAIPSFALLYSMENIINDDIITMKVVGHQWYWSYSFSMGVENYYDNPYKLKVHQNRAPNIINWNFDSYMVPINDLSNKGLRLLETTNPIVLPVETNIKVYITADDVLHSWAVPSLGIKVDACPGRLNQVNLYIDRIGHFYGQCSELCGVNHGFMPIEIYGVCKNDFITYLASNCAEYKKFFIDNLYNYVKEFNINKMIGKNYVDIDIIKVDANEDKVIQELIFFMNRYLSFNLIFNLYESCLVAAKLGIYIQNDLQLLFDSLQKGFRTSLIYKVCTEFQYFMMKLHFYFIFWEFYDYPEYFDILNNIYSESVLITSKQCNDLFWYTRTGFLTNLYYTTIIYHGKA
jgi:cytochrome c oxidase subunit 2